MRYAEWTARWWQWVLSLPVENNPANDTTGKNCAINQNGPVWFLAGTVGGVVERNCTIPAEKAILFPILNHGGTLADSPTIKSEEEFTFTRYDRDGHNFKPRSYVDGVKLSGLRDTAYDRLSLM